MGLHSTLNWRVHDYQIYSPMKMVTDLSLYFIPSPSWFVVGTWGFINAFKVRVWLMELWNGRYSTTSEVFLLFISCICNYVGQDPLLKKRPHHRGQCARVLLFHIHTPASSLVQHSSCAFSLKSNLLESSIYKTARREDCVRGLCMWEKWYLMCCSIFQHISNTYCTDPRNLDSVWTYVWVYNFYK